MLRSFLYRSFAVVVVLVLFTFCAYVVLKGTDEAVAPAAPVPSKARLLMSMHGYSFTRSESGRVSWSMTARTADLYENKEATLKDLQIVFKGEDGKDAVMRGETGSLDTATGNAVIRRERQNVKIITSDGYLLTTDSLQWNAGTRVFWTDDAFKLLGNEIYLEGTGISANVDMSTLVVRNNVKSVLQE